MNSVDIWTRNGPLWIFKRRLAIASPLVMHFRGITAKGKLFKLMLTCKLAHFQQNRFTKGSRTDLRRIEREAAWKTSRTHKNERNWENLQRMLKQSQTPRQRRLLNCSNKRIPLQKAWPLSQSLLFIHSHCQSKLASIRYCTTIDEGCCLAI